MRFHDPFQEKKQPATSSFFFLFYRLIAPGKITVLHKVIQVKLNFYKLNWHMQNDLTVDMKEVV